jgi:hypothetical protein
LEVGAVKLDAFGRQGTMGLRVLFSRCPVVWSAGEGAFLAFLLTAGTFPLNLTFFEIHRATVGSGYRCNGR